MNKSVGNLDDRLEVFGEDGSVALKDGLDDGRREKAALQTFLEGLFRGFLRGFVMIEQDEDDEIQVYGPRTRRRRRRSSSSCRRGRGMNGKIDAFRMNDDVPRLWEGGGGKGYLFESRGDASSIINQRLRVGRWNRCRSRQIKFVIN